jgi:hypothetical protein
MRLCEARRYHGSPKRDNGAWSTWAANRAWEPNFYTSSGKSATMLDPAARKD